MYIILGGAYNGKRQYVTGRFQQVKLLEGNFLKYTYQHGDVVAIGSFEKTVQALIHLPEDEIVEEMLATLLKIDKTCTLICICTDMTRGIVPIDRVDRKVRDCCGRLYQKLCVQNAEVIRIWYGIPQILKEKV